MRSGRAPPDKNATPRLMLLPAPGRLSIIPIGAPGRKAMEIRPGALPTVGEARAADTLDPGAVFAALRTEAPGRTAAVGAGSPAARVPDRSALSRRASPYPRTVSRDVPAALAAAASAALV